MPTKDHQQLLPVLSCLLAATLWGVMWYPLRLLEAWGLSGLWAALIIYTSALLPVFPGFWAQRRGIAQQPLTLLVISAAAGWANLGFILAVLEGNVVRVLLLFYLSPIWTVLLGWFLLDERLSKPAWVSIFIAVAGAIIMLWQPGTSLPVPASTADMLAISAGFAFAVLNVFLRRAGAMPLVLKMTSSSLGVVLLSALGILVMQPLLPVWTASGLILSILIGAAGIVCMTYAAQYGVTHLPVHRSAVLFLVEIVAGAISAALLTDETVALREWTGGALVVLAAWLTAFDTLYGKQSSLSQSNQRMT